MYPASEVAGSEENDIYFDRVKVVDRLISRLNGNYKFRLKIPIDSGCYCDSLLDIDYDDYIKIPYVYAGYIPSGKLIICQKNNLEIYYFEK